MNAPDSHHIAEGWLRVPSEPSIPSPVDSVAPLSSFVPYTTAVYEKHSPGLFRPTNPRVFLIMMSSFVNGDPGPSSGACMPLAHCSSLDHAEQCLTYLALYWNVGREVIENPNWGHTFKVTGKLRTRSFWIKEVDHSSWLKNIHLDEIDGGLGDAWVTDGESHPFAYDLTSTFLADAYWGSAVIDDGSAIESEEDLFVTFDLADTFLAPVWEMTTTVSSPAEDQGESAGDTASSPTKTAGGRSKRVHFED